MNISVLTIALIIIMSIMAGVVLAVEIRDRQWKRALQNFIDEQEEELSNIRRRHKNCRHGYMFWTSVFKTKEEAEEVLTNLIGLSTMSKEISVSDFKNIAGNDSSYLDNKYGWIDLDMKHISISRAQDGYYINLPDPISLE